MGSNLTIVVAAMLFAVGCKSNNFVSVKRDKNIVIDGSIGDWRDNLNFIQDKNFSLGISNDDLNLYIAIVSTDRKLIFQVLRSGFTVWFNNDGGKNKNIGIRYPIGVRGGESSFYKRPDTAYQERKNRDNRFGDKQADIGLEFELLTNGNDEDNIFKIPRVNEIGIDVITVVDEGRLIYEMKFPLNESPETPYSINITLESEIGIGFETKKREVSDRRNGYFGGGRRGGYGGRSGSGGRGGRTRTNIPDMPEKLEYWVKVTLADIND